MTVLKCKMCGGNVIFNEDEKVGVCESCGTKQTITKGNVKKNNKRNEEDVLINDETTTTNIDTYIKRGNIALEDREWVKADSFFEEALNIDAECANAYIGKFLARIKDSNFDEVIEGEKKKIEQYLNLFRAGTITRKQILSEEEKNKYEKHIGEQISKYYIYGYLSADDIREKYNYDNTNISKVEFIISLKNETLESLKNDKIFKRAITYAKEDEKKIIDKFLDDIKTLYDEECKYEEQKENEIISKRRKQIEDLFKQKDKEIVELYNEKLKQKELDEIEKKKKDTMSSRINLVLTVIIIVPLMLLIIYIIVNPIEILSILLLTFPIWFVVFLLVSSGKMLKGTALKVFIVFLIAFGLVKVSSYFKDSGNSSKYIEETKITHEMAQQRFDEFLKEGSYIPIEEFRTKILKITKDSLNIVSLGVENDNSNILVIKYDTKQSDIDDYIKRNSELVDAKYAFVLFNDDVLHVIKLTEKKK